MPKQNTFKDNLATALPKIRFAHTRLLLSVLTGILAGTAASRILLTVPMRSVSFLVSNLIFSVFFTLLFYHGVFGIAASKLKYYPPKTRWIWIGICFLSAILMFFIVPVQLSEHMKTVPAYQLVLTWLALVMVFSSLLLTVSTWLVTRPIDSSYQTPTLWWTWMYYAMIMLTGWFCYLLAFYPGVMSPDSINQWAQMTSGSYRDWHPIFHTLTNWLITRIWFSPAAVAGTQIVALAAAMGWGFSILQRMGARRWALYMLAVFSAVSPGNGMMVITLWKDVFFSIGVLALSLAVLEIVNTQGFWLKQPRRVFFLGLIFASILLYRHNGYFIVPFAIVLLLFFFRSVWKQIVISSLICAAVFLGVRFILYRVINITDYRHAPTTISALNIIAAHFENNTPMNENEMSFLNKVMPLQPNEKSWPYNCYSNDDLFFRNRLLFDYILDHETEIWQLAGRLTIRAPQPSLHYLWCNSAYMFQILRPPNSYYEFGVNTIFPNEFGLQMRSLAPQLQDKINNLISQDPWIWLLGRVAFWFYLSILALSIFAMRFNSPLHFLVFAPSLFVAIPMAFLGGWPAFRYVYPSYLVGILLSGLFFIDQLIAPKVDQEVISSNENDVNKASSYPN